MIDVEITQGKYWNGSQMSYGLYKFLVAFPLTGALGFDHFALRSPITGILKLISLVPLLGFWYFYDIAQAFGEDELTKQYGLSIPFYGPIGLGAGIFGDGKPSPKDIPRPWLFMVYIITTLLFICLPINKLVISDFVGALIQFIYLITIILAPVALVWSIIDIYRGVFDTRGLLEKGGYHMFPSNFRGEYSDRSVLGTLPAVPIPPIISEDVRFAALLGPQAAAAEFVAELSGVDPALRPVTGLKKIPEKIIQKTLDPIMAKMPIDKLKELQKNPIPTLEAETIKAAKESIASIIPAMPNIPDPAAMASAAAANATAKVKAATDAAHSTAAQAVAATKGATDAASAVTKAATDAASQGAAVTKGVTDAASSATKGVTDAASAATKGVTDAASAATKGATDAASAATKIKHVGGGSDDDTTTAFALFTTGIVAFSGYVFYIFRNTFKKPERSDDPPSDPRTVRIPSEAI
jgi:hypothetical protein